MKANLDRSMGHPIAARSPAGHGAAWGAMIAPGTPPHQPAPSMMPVTGRGIATYGHSDAVRGRPIAPPQTIRATTHIAAPQTAIRFQPGHDCEGLRWFRKPQKISVGYGSVLCTGMGHHHIDATSVEYGASTLATLGAEFGVSEGSRNCKRPRVSDRGPESKIFPGIREADSEPRELRWTFCTEKCFDR